MDAYNWANFDGKAFESLIQELLYFEDPNSISYDCLGKDAGIDAISKDEKHVYQMKYIGSLKMSDAIREANKELKKIRKYRDKSNPNYCYWKNVNHWTLIATIRKNPTNIIKWEKEIINKYEDLGIKIDLWSISEIEARLNKYEYLVDIYFHNIIRSITNLNNWKSHIQNAIVNHNFAKHPIIGRKTALSEFDVFLKSDQRFFIIYGTYSIGKSRILYECGKKIEETGRKVFVGLPNIMNNTDSWIKYFKNYNENRYLLIDEPCIDLIKKIYELFSDKSLESWKVIFTVPKTFNENQYFEFENRIDTKSINLKQLSKEQSYALIDNYNNGFRELKKYSIYKLSKGIPGLIDLLFLSYDKGKSFSYNRINLYIQNTLNYDLNYLIILRYFSAWSTIIDNDDEYQISYLAKLLNISEEKIRNIINKLVEIGFVDKSNADLDIYKCGPPLLRFSVLANWFIKENKKINEFSPSNDFKHFINTLLTNEVPRKDLILNSLVDFLSFERLTNLAETFCNIVFIALIDALKKSDNTIDQIKVLDIVERISFLSPENTFITIKTALNLKSSPKDGNRKNVTSLVKYRYDKFDVYQKIIRIIESLIRYDYSTFQIKRIFNGIKKTYITITNYNDIIKEEFNRLLINIYESKTSFDKFKNITFNYINSLSKFDQFDFQIVKSFLISRKTITEFIDKKIIYYDWFNCQDESDWKLACKIKQKLFSKLNNIQSKSRIELWKVIIAIHFDWRQSAFLTKNSTHKDLYLLEVQNDLISTYSFLSNNINSIHNEELIVVHELWEYLLRSTDQNDECFKIAMKCESLYSNKINFKYYRFLSDNINSVEQDSILRDIKNMFSTTCSSKEISSFFDNAWIYLMQNSLDSPSHYNFLAYKLAKFCFDLFSNDNDKYVLFVENSFKSCNNPFLKTFLIYLLRLIIIDLKSKNEYVIENITNICFDSKWIYLAYYKANNDNIGTISMDEFDYILKLNITPNEKIELLPVFIDLDLNIVKNKIEELFSEEKNNLDIMFEKLVDNLYTSLISKSNFNSKGVFIWLIEKLFIKYNLNANIFDNYQFSSIKDICSDKINQDLFVKLISSRIKLEKTKRIDLSFVIWPTFFQVDNWVLNIPSKTAVNNICKLIISNKTILTTNVLPMYLSFMNKDGKTISDFVNNYLSEHDNDVIINNLYCLASLASGFDDDSDSWIIIAKPICEFIENNYTDITNIYEIYYSLLPKTDSNSLETDPFKYENRFEKTQKMLNIENEDSPLLHYREWANSKAKYDVKQLQEILEGEDYE